MSGSFPSICVQKQGDVLLQLLFNYQAVLRKGRKTMIMWHGMVQSAYDDDVKLVGEIIS
jgi:hypothetical protein